MGKNDKSFPLSVVLSVIHQRPFACKAHGQYGLLRHILKTGPIPDGEKRYRTACIAAAAVIFEQKGELRGVHPPGFRSGNPQQEGALQTWLAQQEEVFGKTIALHPLTKGEIRQSPAPNLGHKVARAQVRGWGKSKGQNRKIPHPAG